MNIKLRLFLAVVCLGVNWSQSEAALLREEVVSRCLDMSREELEPCLIKLINELQPQFAEGLPEFGIPPSDVIHLHSLNFTEKTSDKTFVDGTFYDIIVKDFDEMILKSLKLDYDAHTAKVELEFPNLFVSGQYILNASFSLVPLVGEGTFWMSIDGVKADGVSTFDFVKTEDGDYHLHTKHIDFDFDYDHINLRLNNLAKDNAVIRQAAEAIVRDNARDMITYLKPQMIDQIIKVILDLSQDFGMSLKLEEMAGKQYIREAFNIP